MLQVNDLSEDELQQWQYELREIEPLIHHLGISYKQVEKRHRKPLDFEMKYGEKNIAIEVTDVRPYLKDFKLAKGSTEDAIKNIIKECITDSHVAFFQINIMLKIETYGIKKIRNNNKLRAEIIVFLKYGHSKNSTYIEDFHIEECPDVNFPKENISFNFQHEGFLHPLPIDCIHDAIRKKNGKLHEYKKQNNKEEKNFDEFWLCLGFPLEERGYTICGLELPSGLETGYHRIYITQQFPPKVIQLYPQ